MKLVVTLTFFCSFVAVAAPAKKTKINTFKIYNSCPTAIKAALNWHPENSPWQTIWFEVEPNTASQEIYPIHNIVFVYAEDSNKKSIWQGDCRNVYDNKNIVSYNNEASYCASPIKFNKNEYADYVLNLKCD